jgi:ornithine cyclodeaminase
MRVLILSEHDVEELLTMTECIAVMEEALSALARGEVHNPLRHAIRPAGAAGLLGLMPAYRSGERPVFALKEVCVFPGNPARGLDTHLGAVLLHDGETGALLAIMNAAAITAIRTAAVSAVATRVLAREDARVLAIIGTGAQGRAHMKAIPLVRDIKDVRLVGRKDSIEDAVRGADIIVTATNSREPILRREWISPGAHINAVGSSIAAARELDAETIAAASLFIDRRESTVNESGDYLFAVREGAINEGHIRAEIGDILVGKAAGRRSPDEITLFKSLGLAVEDLASAAFLYDKAPRSDRGTWVEF